MTRPYLDRLLAVDWGSLEHAYGAADDVPDALVRLATGDQAAAAETLGGMYGTICHQDSVYSATLAAVPFLAEIALDSEVTVRDGVVELLCHIADAPFGFVEVADWLTDRPTAEAEGAGFGMTVEGPCRDAVLAVAPRLLEAFPTASPATQIWTLSLVADLPEAYSELGPRLAAVIPAGMDEWVLPAAALCRVCWRPGADASACERARILSMRVLDGAEALDQGVVSNVLAKVADHLTHEHPARETAQLLGRYAEQLPRIVYQPSWRDDW